MKYRIMLCVIVSAVLTGACLTSCASTSGHEKYPSDGPVDPRPPPDRPPEPALGGSAQTAQAVMEAVAGSRGAAQRGIETLRKLITEQNLRSMGFETQQQVQVAELGQGLAHVRIRLDQLREQRGTLDPYALLQPPASVHWQVVQGGNVRSSVITERPKGEWEAVSFGGAELIKAIARQQQADRPSSKAMQFVASVPALKLVFLARQDEAGGQLLFTSVHDDKASGLMAGDTSPAATVLQRLVELARSHDGNPR